MKNKAISIRPFIGSKNFDLSRGFYRAMDFQETRLDPKLSVFKTGNLAFYLQDAYVSDWINNTMIFLEVEDVEQYYGKVEALNLSEKYEGVKLVPIHNQGWGREFFLHDPSGILWHIGQFAE